MGLPVSRTPMRIGNSSIKAQGKILVQLENNTLPKIGSLAKIQREGSFMDIGEVIEVIGSTKKPWIVILAKKEKLDVLKEGESVFTEDRPPRDKGKKQRRWRKGTKSNRGKK